MKKKIKKSKVIKIVQWYNKKKREIFFGLDIKIGNSFMHMCEGGKPLFFKTRPEAFKKRKQIQS